VSGARTAAREAIVRFGRRLLDAHLVQWTSGNLSMRVPGEPDLIVLTPTSLPYDELEPADVVIATVAGKVVDGRHEPTSEFPLHTLVYARRPEVGAIVHAHSPAAMAMASLGWALPAFLTGLVDATGGAVTTAPYARPGTAALADAVEAALAERGACFLRGHGLLAIGATIERAFYAAVVTEASADAYLRARAAGERPPELPPGEEAWLAEGWRAQWRTRPVAGGSAAGPTR
jgi:L-ribulose-5-phosphate 4-epimerase